MKNKHIISVLFCLFSLSEIYASHIMGADISYKYISGKKYEFTFKMYRDCSGIPLNNPDVYVRSADNAINYNLSSTRISIKDISLRCDTTSGPCSPANTLSSFGVEEHTYVAEIDFAASPYNNFVNNGVCEVFFSVEQCCRNGAITTMQPGNFYTQAMINVCEIDRLKNSSPVFKTYPIQYLCVNEYTAYSSAPIEPDWSDSLSFELVAPMTSIGTDATFNTPFTASNPITTNQVNGFVFDNKSGDVTILPTNPSQIGVMVIQVSEWRKDSLGVMKKIGYVRREMELIMKNCGSINNAPYMTGNNTYAICEGNKICVSFNAKDDPFLPNQTVNDTVRLTNINPIPGATFKITDSTAREKEGQLCWQTRVGDARTEPYRTTFKAEDNNCADPRYAYKTVRILIKPIAKFNRFYVWGYRGMLHTEVVPINLGAVPQYQVVIRDSSMQVVYNGSSLKDSFKFTYSGKYYIEHVLTGKGINCPKIIIDTLTVTDVNLTEVNPLLYQSIQIFPNPNQGNFKLMGIDVLDIISSKVYTMDGKQLVGVTVIDGEVDMSACPEGNYLIVVETPAGFVNKRIIISR